VLIGDPSNMASLVKKPGVYSLVGFFAPWCGHCKAVTPAWNKVADLYADESRVQVISVDADAHRSLAEKYSVQGFPTIKLFAPGSEEPEDYTGGRTVDAFLDHINQRAGTDIMADGSISPVSGLMPHVHGALAGFLKKNAKDQEQMLNAVSEAVAASNDQGAQEQWQTYVKVGKKIIDEGVEFLSREKKRITRMLKSSAGSISPDQLKNFQRRVNVLTAFDEL
jgi:protein disulfide-isomerase A6